ncbi:unnamed protein product, partial [Meganyctiphanes norvegica]
MAGAKPGVHQLTLKPVVVPQQLQNGDKFVKWDEDSSSGTPVTLKVDPNGFFLYWSYWGDQNFHETEVLDILHIRDTRTNKYARVPRDSRLRDQVNIGSAEIPLEEKSFTVVHGPTFVDISYINFVGQKTDTVKVWSDELLKMSYNLMAINSASITFLKKAHVKMCLVLDRNGKIPVKTVVKMFSKHPDDKRRVEEALKDAGLAYNKADGIPKDKFTWDAFLHFYNKLTTRVEVEKVFCELTGQDHLPSKSRPMRVEQLVDFLNDHQRDPRLNEILYPYADAVKAKEVIMQYEPNKDNISKNVLSCEGFLSFLLSDNNMIMSLEMLDLHEDMEQPLAHYFINSSHNTYLVGHQLTGRSSVEMYRQCLLAGCRCVELDLWNGENANEEPVIVHGFTFVPKISAREVIEAIAECAFKTSEWPVILSFENHCNPRQQAKIAQYCREYFKEMLLDLPLDSYTLEPGFPLPPPSALKRKIIIKNRKDPHLTKHHKHHNKKNNTESSDAQFHVELNQTAEGRPVEMQGNGEIPRPPLEKENSASSEENQEIANGEVPIGGEEVETSSSSDDDSDVEEGALTPEEIENKERENKERGTAKDEEAAGAEISALVNYVQPVRFRSFDVSEKKNKSYEMSSFVETQSLNLLKESPVEFVNYNKRQLSRVYPRGARVDSSNFFPHQFWNAGCQLVALNYQTLDLPMQLNLGIFEFNQRTGFLLKPDFMRRPDRRFDPFAVSTVDGIIAGTVSIKVISGQFLSDRRTGCYVEIEMYGLPADTVRKRFKTSTVSNNTLNPVWNENPIVFKKVVLPGLATIRLVVYDESRTILGTRILPMSGLRPGYKHIMLRNESGQPLSLASLFVYIKVGDYVPDAMSGLAEALANPIKYQSELEKRAQALTVFQDDDEIEDFEGDRPHTPLKTVNSDPSSGGSTKTSIKGKTQPSTDSDTKKEITRQGSNGEVHDNKSTPPVTRLPTDPVSPRVLTNRPSDDKPMGGDKDYNLNLPDISNVVIEAEPLEKIWKNKTVKKKKEELEKSMEALRKKHEKQRQDLMQGQEKKKSQLLKTKSKLIKKKSNRGPDSKTESTQDLTGAEEEHEVKLRELELAYQTDLQNLLVEQLLAERKLHEKYHEPIYSCLEKAVKASQATIKKNCKAFYDKSVEDIQRKTEEQLREELKGLNKGTTDKEELSRKKLEVRNNIRDKVFQVRKRLKLEFDKKEEELDAKHEEVRTNF